ncbi:transglutaminase-like cysteine peptidase [Mesorhizobium sp. M0058]|uniref:transglutaminase-like cysteine peptidase n=1 Tax=Mesorhizobium sp. M0058 TaxID=2956865 RepID=UPI003334F36E
MKKEKSALGITGLRLILLAMAITSLPQPSSAKAITVNAGAAAGVLAAVETPSSLGGVSLARPQPWQPVPAYWIGMIFSSSVAVDEKRGSSIAPPAAGIDPIQTAAIIPGVFGSVALSMRNFPVSARWAPVYKAIVDCTASSACERKNSAFAEIVKAAGNKRFTDKLSFVNSSINRAIAYKKDSVVYGKLDYWAKPREILERRAGDCEDFAILKMAALLHAGIPAQSMSLVVLQDRKRGFFHAVLSVSTGSGVFILDSLSNVVSRDTDLPTYVPLYSFSTDRAWIHGAKTGSAQIADIKGGLSTVAPGEGMQP